MPIAAGIHYFLHEGGRQKRTPLVLIHGAGGDHLSWPPEIRRLTDERVFTLDLPGHGKSKGPGRQSVADYAESVVGFMNAADLSRAVFIGHALGGAIALTLAIDHPQRVAGIGLISIGSAFTDFHNCAGECRQSRHFHPGSPGTPGTDAHYSRLQGW